MKKIVVCLAVIIGLIMARSVLAEGKKTAALTQLMIVADHSFWENKSIPITGYASATYYYNLNSGYSAIYGYAGPKFKLNKIGIYTLAMIRADAYAWAPGPSLWLDYSHKKDYWFAEFDYYVPWLTTSHDETAALLPHQYYSAVEYNRSFKDNIRLGWMVETFGAFNQNKPSELATGPTVSFKKFKVMAFYDTTPLVEGADYLGLRFKLFL